MTPAASPAPRGNTRDNIVAKLRAAKGAPVPYVPELALCASDFGDLSATLATLEAEGAIARGAGGYVLARGAP